MAVITSAISLGGGYTFPESKLHKVVYVKTGHTRKYYPLEFRERVAIVGDELRS